MGYAVIDLETTGFSPARGDRIIEVGVVLLDESGSPEAEWASLVNPQRDIGPTHVHGIRASDVVDAPLFGDIAAHLVMLLGGRTLVAHNQGFDLRFLRAELASNGFVLPTEYSALCTMLWSRAVFGAAKLRDVCDALGIEHASAHAALGDARATAAVLATFIQLTGHPPRWDEEVSRAVFPLDTSAWTDVVAVPRPVSSPESPLAFVDTAALPLWERVSIPVDADDAGASVYLDMLTRVLEDGLISTVEYSRLDAIAEVAHLAPERVTGLHAAYLAAAVSEASADGVVTDDERRELAQIATILDQPIPEASEATGNTGSRMGAGTTSSQPRPRAGADPESATEAAFVLAPGARVVFTGTMRKSREEWAHEITSAGFVTGSVTKNCVVLVAADPSTQSGKAKTARRHGIPIVTEAEFSRAFDAYRATA